MKAIGHSDLGKRGFKILYETAVRIFLVEIWCMLTTLKRKENKINTKALQTAVTIFMAYTDDVQFFSKYF